MKTNLQRVSRILCATVLFTLSLAAQEHQWAGRTLDNLEWTIHEKLAALPSYGVFDTVRFEVHGKTVTLSGQVVKESVKHNAARMVRQISGVAKVINQIEVLPSSRRDDALRMNVYRAIYQQAPQSKDASGTVPPIHIIVKNGWVTLEGVVDSDAARSLVHNQALKVTSHVSKNLRIAPESLVGQR